MNRLLLFSALTGVVLLTACSTGSGTTAILNDHGSSYIQKNNVSGKDSTHIAAGRIYRGMPVRHAIAALGQPRRVDTSSWNGNTKLKITYRARPKKTRGYMKKAYVYAVNDSVTTWEGLNTIPRFDAYYEVGN